MPGKNKMVQAKRAPRTTPESATYVYCVVKAARGTTRAKARAPEGLEGTGKLHELDAGDGYSLLVADAPLALYAAHVIDAKLRDLDWVGHRAMEHEAVVEHATRLGTVIPMKLFTIFSSEERALAHVAKLRRSLDRVVERIEGCEEWGLRVFFDQVRASRASVAADAKGPVSSGKEFLLRKKAIDEARRKSGALLATEVDALYDRLATGAREARRRPVPVQDLSGKVLLDAVFLVPNASVAKLKAAVSSAAEKLVDAGFDLTLTGPWPAYSFIGAT